MLAKVIDAKTLSIGAGDNESVMTTTFTKENTVIFRRMK